MKEKQIRNEQLPDNSAKVLPRQTLDSCASFVCCIVDCICPSSPMNCRLISLSIHPVFILTVSFVYTYKIVQSLMGVASKKSTILRLRNEILVMKSFWQYFSGMENRNGSIICTLVELILVSKITFGLFLYTAFCRNNRQECTCKH